MLFSVLTNNEGATENIIKGEDPKILLSAGNIHKGQTLVELAPVKSNMLARHAARGKGEQCEGGGRRDREVLCCSVVPGEL